MSVFDRYLFLFDESGFTVADPKWVLTTDLLNEKLDQHVERFMKSNPAVTEVWVIPYCTQAMVDMIPPVLADFVRKNGRKIA